MPPKNIWTLLGSQPIILKPNLSESDPPDNFVGQNRRFFEVLGPFEIDGKGEVLVAWIRTISFVASSGKLRQLYERITGQGNNVDNIMMLHSLRPNTMEGHMALYKFVLHHTGNTLPKWFLEAIGTYVSYLNKCDYCFEHHFVGLMRDLKNDERAHAIREAITTEQVDMAPLSMREIAALKYARKLTITPARMIENDVKQLRAAGFDDGQILEINQVTAYFSYANRTVLGLGCNLEGDIIGLSPNNSEDPDDWSHQ